MEMARQVIDNASGRARSFYLLGFAQAIYRQPPELTGINGLNAERKAWHIAGHIHGRYRIGEVNEVYPWVKANQAAAEECLNAHSTAIRRMIAPILASCAVIKDDADLYLLATSGVKVDDSDSVACLIAMSGLKLAHELSRPGKFEEVFKVLPEVRRIAQELLRKVGSEYHEEAHFILAQHDRREAVARLGHGDVSAAVNLFGRIAAEGEPSERVEARAWLAMAKAGINDFFAIYPSDTEQKFNKAGEKMQALVREVDNSGLPYEDLSVTVVACLGIASVYGKAWSDAARHFGRACELMRLDQRLPSNRSFLWVRFMRAACQVLAMDHSNPESVAADIEAVADSKVKPAAWFYANMVEAATLFPEPRVLQAVVAAMPQEDSEKKFMAYEAADLLRSDCAKRQAYVNWLPVSRRPKERICNGLERVIDWDLASGRTDSAEQALDLLESLASDSNAFAERLLRVLDRPELVPDLMTEAEVIECKSRLLFQLGRDMDAITLLVERFRREASSANTWHREQSLGLLDALEAMGADLTSVGMLRARVRQEFATEAVTDDGLASAGPIRILYVGGNEIQRRYEAAIKAGLAQRYPNLSVDFDFPGWSSNWNVEADSVRARLPNYHGLVLSYFVRTQLGRTIRKLCNDTCPWWAAPGHGRDAITRGILIAARHAASRRQG
jgi:hypothetical protein